MRRVSSRWTLIWAIGENTTNCTIVEVSQSQIQKSKNPKSIEATSQGPRSEKEKEIAKRRSNMQLLLAKAECLPAAPIRQSIVSKKKAFHFRNWIHEQMEEELE